MRKIIIVSLAIFWVAVLAILGNGLKNSNSPVAFQGNDNSTANITSSTASMVVKTLSLSEVAKHKTANDCWMIVNNKVYNITSYLPYHPGGINAILSYCGQDGSQAFAGLPHSQNASNLLASYFVGNLNAVISAPTAPTAPTASVSAPRINLQSRIEDDD